jgi:predicted RNA-binding protein with RPS1 domain
MAHIAANLLDHEDSKEFAALLAESLGETQNFEGKVVKGKVVGFESDLAIIDVGLKSEGRVDLREFTKPGEDLDLKIGDEVDVFIERMEGRDGMTSLSREKARREEAWVELEKQHEANERVTGIIFSRVKGGFTVDLGGAVAFLPGSQVDIRPVRDVSPLMGTPQPFYVLKMDKTRGNIVVSRRAVLEESRQEARSDLMENLSEGQVLQGVVKNITDYGAFIDLGGVDGLLHVTDISWKRVNHPSEVLEVGKTIDVQVIRYNQETQRISLVMKQLETDPWDHSLLVAANSLVALQTSLITAHLLNLAMALKALSTFQKCLGQRKTHIQVKSFLLHKKLKLWFWTLILKNAVFHLVSNSVKITHGHHSLRTTNQVKNLMAKFATSLSSVCLLVCLAILTAWFTFLTFLGMTKAKKRLKRLTKVIALKLRSLTSMLKKSVLPLVSSSFLTTHLQAPLMASVKAQLLLVQSQKLTTKALKFLLMTSLKASLRKSTFLVSVLNNALTVSQLVRNLMRKFLLLMRNLTSLACLLRHVNLTKIKRQWMNSVQQNQVHLLVIFLAQRLMKATRNKSFVIKDFKNSPPDIGGAIFLR